MWSHKPWNGRWVAPRTPASEAIRAYSRFCTAVEGNTTFYAVPSVDTVARWSEQAPAHFRFLFKLPRTVTHERRLAGAGDLIREFLCRIEPLRDRCGPLLIQLPASFGPRDLPSLRAFLSAAPTEWDWAVELRHAAFFDDADERRRVNALLSDRGVDRVVLDSRALFAGPCVTPEEQDAFNNKPRLTVRPVATARQPVVRLIGQTEPAANPPFWEKWVGKVVEWLAEGRSPTVFLHTADNAAAPDLVQWFAAEVQARLGDSERAVLPAVVEPLTDAGPHAVGQRLFD